MTYFLHVFSSLINFSCHLFTYVSIEIIQSGTGEGALSVSFTMTSYLNDSNVTVFNSLCVEYNICTAETR